MIQPPIKISFKITIKILVSPSILQRFHSLSPSSYLSSIFHRISALLNFFQGWYLNGPRPATARPRDVSEHVHVAVPLLRWGWKRHGYTNPPLKATRLHAIDPGEPTSIHERFGTGPTNRMVLPGIWNKPTHSSRWRRGSKDWYDRFTSLFIAALWS